MRQTKCKGDKGKVEEEEIRRGVLRKRIQPMKYFNINIDLFFIIIYDLKCFRYLWLFNLF